MIDLLLLASSIAIALLLIAPESMYQRAFRRWL
jgi:hypothetical protein